MSLRIVLLLVTTSLYLSQLPVVSPFVILSSSKTTSYQFGGLHSNTCPSQRVSIFDTSSSRWIIQPFSTNQCRHHHTQQLLAQLEKHDDSFDDMQQSSQSTTIRNNLYKIRNIRYKQIPKRIRKWIRRTAISLYFTSSIITGRPSLSSASTHTQQQAQPPPPVAAVISPISSKQATTPPKAVSIRPGMSKTQIDALEHGDTSIIQQLEQAPSIFQPTTSSGSSTSATATPTTTTSTTISKTFSEYGDTLDEDDDELLQLIDEDQFGSPKVATLVDKNIGDKLRASSQDQFAAYHQSKTFGLTLKVSLAFFVPTYGFMIGREYVRRRREERYVKKGLEILEAQKAEYFNITNTKNDVDVEDELKNLKNKNSTNTDGDDDDEDDDDDDNDDDDDEPVSRRPPRKPIGGGGGSGGSGGSPKNIGGGGESTGSGSNTKPSAADIDKLNKLLGKS